MILNIINLFLYVVVEIFLRLSKIKIMGVVQSLKIGLKLMIIEIF